MFGWGGTGADTVAGAHRRRRMGGRRLAKGQSVAEFALVLPLLMLLLLVAVDFGRAYMGWVELNNAARVAANYAGQNPTGQFGSGSAYATLVSTDATGSNCPLTTVSAPTFTHTPPQLGDQAQVTLTCEFNLIIGSFPGFGQLLPNPATLSATAYFPVRKGSVAVGPPACSGTPPVASFTPSAISGVSPLTVTFTDTSTGYPTSWNWNFGDGQGSPAENPSHQFASGGTYLVALTATNACGSSVASTTITVTGLTAAFAGTPTSGAVPLTVTFSDQSTPTGQATGWTWNFGDTHAAPGTDSSSQENPTHTYSVSGTYTVTLTVTDGTTSATTTKINYITVGCVVPNLVGNPQNQAQAAWTAAGFSTTVQYATGNANSASTVTSQTIVGGTVDPTCASIIQVSH